MVVVSRPVCGARGTGHLGTFTCLFPETVVGAARRTSARAAVVTHGGRALKKRPRVRSLAGRLGATPGRAGPPGQRGVGAGVTWRRGGAGVRGVRGCCRCRGRRTSDPASVPAPTVGAGPPPTLSYAPAPLIVSPPPGMICRVMVWACTAACRASAAGQGNGGALAGPGTRGVAATCQMLKCCPAAASPLCPSCGGRRGGRRGGHRSPPCCVGHQWDSGGQGVAGTGSRRLQCAAPAVRRGAACHAGPPL